MNDLDLVNDLLQTFGPQRLIHVVAYRGEPRDDWGECYDIRVTDAGMTVGVRLLGEVKDLEPFKPQFRRFVIAEMEVET